MRVKVSLSLDPVLMRTIDEYVERHGGTDRSKVVNEALELWSAARQRADMERQFADDEADAAELDAWHQVRRAAALRRLGAV